MKHFIQFLTYFRIISGPVIYVLIINFNFHGLALILFIGASASDYFDGLLARKYNLESPIGEILDPVADKILILFLIFALCVYLDSNFIAFIGAMMLAREFWVGALREFNARNNMSQNTKVTFLAKIKTSVQMCAFGMYLLGVFLDNVFVIFLADFVLLSAFILSVQSAISYTSKTFSITAK